MGYRVTPRDPLDYILVIAVELEAQPAATQLYFHRASCVLSEAPCLREFLLCVLNATYHFDASLTQKLRATNHRPLSS